MKDDNQPAFPANFYAETQALHPFSGLTKREWFAGMALTSISEGLDLEAGAKYCFEMADAMIEAGKK